MKKPKRITILLVCIGLVIMIMQHFVSYMNPFISIETETENISAYAIDGTLIHGGKKIDLYKLMKLEKEFEVEEILYIQGSIAYIVYTYVYNGCNWIVAAVDLDTGIVEECFVFADTDMPYMEQPGRPYNERNGYYLDGQIVLSNGRYVLVYDIMAKTEQRFSYAEYDFSECKVYGDFMDGISVQLVVEGNETILTLEDLLGYSESVNKILALRSREIWDSNNSLYDFFSDYSVQYVGDRMYLIGRCLNYFGSSFAVIFEYDIEDSVWKYAANQYTWDNCHRRMYIIPNG